MQMALSHGHLEVVQRLCAATLRMTEGELLASSGWGDRPDVEEYFEVVERKTAHLFAAPAPIPSPSPPCARRPGQVLHRYGRALGSASSWSANLLDFTPASPSSAKPVLSDLKEGKLHPPPDPPPPAGRPEGGG